MELTSDASVARECATGIHERNRSVDNDIRGIKGSFVEVLK